VSNFQELYEADLCRYTGKTAGWIRCFHFFLRKTQTCRSKILKPFYNLGFRIISAGHCMELSHAAVIGKGFFLRDPYLITINSNSVLGENVTLGKNVTIGKQNRGKYEGSPVIGDRVEIGENAVVVGKIRIGDDVMIASDSYVNRDVPDGAFVSGNPFVIR